MENFTSLFYCLLSLNIFSPPKVLNDAENTDKNTVMNSGVASGQEIILSNQDDSPEVLLKKTTEVLENLCKAFLSQSYTLWDYRIHDSNILRCATTVAALFVSSYSDRDCDLALDKFIESQNKNSPLTPNIDIGLRKEFMGKFKSEELIQSYLGRIIKIIVLCVEWSKKSKEVPDEVKKDKELRVGTKLICPTYNQAIEHIDKIITNIPLLINKIEFGEYFEGFIVRFMREYCALICHKNVDRYYKLLNLLENNHELILMNDELIKKSIEFSSHNSDDISVYLLNSFIWQEDKLYLEKFVVSIWGETIAKSFMKACLENDFLKNQHSRAVLGMEGKDITERRFMFYLMQEYFDRYFLIYITFCPNMILSQLVKNLLETSKNKRQGLLSSIIPKIKAINSTQDNAINTDKIFEKYENIDNYNNIDLHLKYIDRDLKLLSRIDLPRYLKLLEHIKSKTKNTSLIEYIDKVLFRYYSLLCDQRLLSLGLDSLPFIKFLVRLEFEPESVDISKVNKLELALYHRKKGNMEQHEELMNECFLLEDLYAIQFALAYNNLPIIIKRKLLAGTYGPILFNNADLNLQSQDVERIKKVFMLPADTEFFEDIATKDTKIVIDDVCIADDLDEQNNSDDQIIKKNVKNKVNDDDSSDDSSISGQESHKENDTDLNNDKSDSDSYNSSDNGGNLEDEITNQTHAIYVSEVKTNKSSKSKGVTDSTSDQKLVTAANKIGLQLEHSKGRRQTNNLIIKYTEDGIKKQYSTHWHGSLPKCTRKLLISLINSRSSLNNSLF